MTSAGCSKSEHPAPATTQAVRPQCSPQVDVRPLAQYGQCDAIRARGYQPGREVHVPREGLHRVTRGSQSSQDAAVQGRGLSRP